MKSTTIAFLIVLLFISPFVNAQQVATYITKEKYKANKSSQAKADSSVLEQLRKLMVDENKQLKLEYFFYTNTTAKAKSLAEALKKIGYSSDYKVGADGKDYVITGWTTSTKMSNIAVTQWSEFMCDIGYKYDCDFDGWGTDPTQ